MKKYIWSGIILFSLFVITLLFSQPSFNGPTPGCGSGGGCHTPTSGILKLTTSGDLTVTVSFTGVQGIGKIAGELMDSDSNIVDVVNSTSNSTFTLTATEPGSYTVNAGFKNPSREWDTGNVTFTATGLKTPGGGTLPEALELLGNHPNPFNNETLIRFSVPNNTTAEMLIYDITGRTVRHLTEGKFSGGLNVVRWDGRDDTGKGVASGTYICQLRSATRQVSRKLMFSK